MAGAIHWFGVLLLFISSILLLITTISAPVINHISLLRVTLPTEVGLQHTSVSFGTFGYCMLDVPNAANGNEDQCTHSHMGYSPSNVVSHTDHTQISTLAAGTSDGLTRVMVLHPIACGVAFIAFLLSVGHSMLGSFAGAMVALLAWILTLVSLAVDFSLFGVIHHHVNDAEESSGAKAHFGAGIWCLTAAFVTLLVGMCVVFFTCCSARREKKRNQRVRETEKASPPPAHAAPRRRKRFGLF